MIRAAGFEFVSLERGFHSSSLLTITAAPNMLGVAKLTPARTIFNAAVHAGIGAKLAASVTKSVQSPSARPTGRDGLSTLRRLGPVAQWIEQRFPHARASVATRSSRARCTNFCTMARWPAWFRSARHEHG